MAKKKVNKRYDYESEAQDKVVYERSRIQRKMNFLILRGPGTDTESVLDENEKIRRMGTLQHFKMKFIQCKTVEEAATQIKDSNVWAGGVVFYPGTLDSTDPMIVKTIQKILIPVETLSMKSEVTSASYLAALKKFLQKPAKK
jgi:hypothetical protein